MPPVGFEPTFSAGERPQTYALDHVATGTITVLPWSPQITSTYAYLPIVQTLIRLNLLDITAKVPHTG